MMAEAMSVATGAGSVAESAPAPPRPEDHPRGLPWPPVWRMYPANSPAWSEQESEAAFNEDWARADFGEAFVAALARRHAEFKGDWWLLAMLTRCAEVKQNARNDAKPDTNPSTPGNAGATLANERGASPGRYAWWRRGFEAVYFGLGAGARPRAHLERASLARWDLAKIDLRWARLDRGDLSGARLAGADLSHASLRGVEASSADFGGAVLIGARLDDAVLLRGNFAGSALNWAQGAGALLAGADLSGAALHQADLDRANLRNVRGVLYDSNTVDRVDSDPDAGDPWSVLRRRHTPLALGVTVGLAVLYFVPGVVELVGAWAATRAGEAAQEAVRASPGFGEGEALRPWVRHFHDTHRLAPAASILLGATRGLGVLHVAAGLVVVAYALLRAKLTLSVGVLREHEQRFKRTPMLEEYAGVCHPLSERPRDWLGAWWTRAQRWMKATERDGSMWEWRKKSLALLSPVPTLGLWRLHRVAWWMRWFFALAVAWSLLRWAFFDPVAVRMVAG